MLNDSYTYNANQELCRQVEPETGATLMGLAFLSYCISCAVSKERIDARKLFFASIIYLPLLLAFLMWDKR